MLHVYFNGFVLFWSWTSTVMLTVKFRKAAFCTLSSDKPTHPEAILFTYVDDTAILSNNQALETADRNLRFPPC